MNRVNDEELIDEALRCGQQFINSIMHATAADPIPDSNGMAVVKNVFDLETGMTGDIVLRRNTIPFWQACIDAVNTPRLRLRVAAIGNPGIGKTTSTPWLIRMLLEKSQTVVYLIRSNNKSNWYYEFVPSCNDSMVAVKIYPETLTANRIPSLRRHSTYYIVDPSQTKDDCNPPTDFAAKVILVPSPESRHWGGSEFEKQRGDVCGVFRYFPTWSCEELLLARPILRPDMSEDQVCERFHQLGGVPRHIFDFDIEAELKAQNRAICALSSEQVIEIALGRMHAFDDFYGVPRLNALIAFRLSADDNGTFKNGESYIVSNVASEKIYSNLRLQPNLWSEMLLLGPTGGGGIIFEMMARHRIASGKPTKEFEGRCVVGKRNPCCTRDSLRLTLGTTKNMESRQVRDPLQAAATTTCANVVFHSFSRTTNSLFDFLYKDSVGHFHFFQATIGQSHMSNAEHIIKELQKKFGDVSKMSFYFLMPSELFRDVIATMPVTPDVACDVYHVLIPNPSSERSGVVQARVCNKNSCFCTRLDPHASKKTRR